MPATHEFFGRPEFPLSRLMESGANVCLGSDSLASADTLSMLEILKRTHSKFRALPAEQILATATANGAALLGAAGSRIGRIATGFSADVIAIKTMSGESCDIVDLFNKESAIAAVWVGARPVSSD